MVEKLAVVYQSMVELLAKCMGLVERFVVGKFVVGRFVVAA
jgi:hypothetical protein